MGLCIAIFATLALGLSIAGAAPTTQSAILEALSPRVTLARDGAVDQVTVERVIQSGDRVSTDGTGRALITYPDGSTATLEENSAVVVEFVHTSATDYVVRMEQTLGRVWYAVTRAVTSGTRYEVLSPGMASVVRAGSDSYVAVAESGATTIVAISGTIATTAAGSEVTVPGGTATVVESGSSPRAPLPAPSLTPPVTMAQTPPPVTSPLVVSPPYPAALASAPLLGALTPKPAAAPAPVAPAAKDKYGPRKIDAGPPPLKTAKPN